MKRTLLALATAAATAATVVPAFAQPYGPPPPPAGMRDMGPGYGYGRDFYRGAPATPWERIQWLQQRIERARANGAINPREAFRVQRELDRTREYIRTARQRYGDLRPQDRAYVDQRLDYVRNLIRWQRQNGY